MHMRIFLSYSRQDNLLADNVVKALQEVSGVTVERDRDRPSPGASLPERLRTQIAESDACFFLITPASIKSKWVNAEHSWARSLGKKIVLIVEHGVKLDDIPDVDPNVENIQYDPVRYSESLSSLTSTVLALRAHYGSESAKAPLPEEERMSSGIRELQTDEIERLLSLSSGTVAESLQPYLVDAAARAVEQFFSRPEFTKFVNIATLETDGKALVIRAETLHALMAASASGTAKEFGAAGYRAGVSFGLGIAKWFMEKSKSVKGVSGLPKDEWDLIRAATKIDEASNWGRITLGKRTKGRSPELWSADINIERDFLSAYYLRREGNDPQLLAKHLAFWSAYLEGTFSAAIAVSHGLRDRTNASYYAQQMLTRVTHISEDSKSLALRFRVSCVVQIHHPLALENLCREVLCPYVMAEYTRVVSRARTVVEGFVRELADAEESSAENIQGALQWLAQKGPNAARDAASMLQRARGILNKAVHVGDNEVSEAEAYAVMQAVAPAVLRALHEIELTGPQKNELRLALTSPKTKNHKDP